MFKKALTIMLAGIIAVGMLAGCAGNAQAPNNETLTVAGPDDLANARIGVQEGTTGDIYVTENYPDATIERYKKAVDAAVDLKNGRLDAIVLDAIPSQKIVANTDGLTILDQELTVEEYAIAVRKEDTELLNSINEILKAKTEDGTLDTYYKYFVAAEEGAALPERTTAEATNGELIMGTNAEFEPFEYHKDDEIVGFDIEMAKDIAAGMGKELKIEDMNFDSLIVALNSGKVDMVVAGMTTTDERKEEVNFSEPYFNASQVIIVPAK
jgi:ABC-type amino acid transport substrate-binding protein